MTTIENRIENAGRWVLEQTGKRIGGHTRACTAFVDTVITGEMIPVVEGTVKDQRRAAQKAYEKSGLAVGLLQRENLINSIDAISDLLKDGRVRAVKVPGILLGIGEPHMVAFVRHPDGSNQMSIIDSAYKDGREVISVEEVGSALNRRFQPRSYGGDYEVEVIVEKNMAESVSKGPGGGFKIQGGRIRVVFF